MEFFKKNDIYIIAFVLLISVIIYNVTELNRMESEIQKKPDDTDIKNQKTFISISLGLNIFCLFGLLLYRTIIKKKFDIDKIVLPALIAFLTIQSATITIQKFNIFYLIILILTLGYLLYYLLPYIRNRNSGYIKINPLMRNIGI